MTVRTGTQVSAAKAVSVTLLSLLASLANIKM